MMTRLISFLIISSFILTGCIERRAFFLNPYQGITPTYRSVQLQQDSIRSAFQATGALITSQANPQYNDHVFQFNANISRTHTHKFIGFRYGASFSYGSYEVSRIDSFGNSNTVDYKYINDHAGNYSTGGYGIDGAVHLLHVNDGVEWRVVGMEFTLNKEFGDFYKFRLDMPRNSATIIDSADVFSTLGVYTEVINTKGKMRPGFKFGYGRALRPALGTSDGNFFDLDHVLKFKYYTFAGSIRTERSTFFLQMNLGEKGRSVQAGGSFRLGRW